MSTCGHDLQDSAPLNATLSVALIGNPNTGKSTLFNRFTGARQRVGNYPGVTVSKKTGEMSLGDGVITIVDLPGTYSLAATSLDERIAADVLTGRKGPRPRLAVCTADATHLQRSLFLACQIADLGVPVIIALNFMDEAESKGLAIDAETLSSRLGVPVIPISARGGKGVDKLREAIHAALSTTPQMALPEWSAGVKASTSLLQEELEKTSNSKLTDAELRRILFDNNSAYLDLVGYPSGKREGMLDRVRKPILEEGTHALAKESLGHYSFISGALEGIITQTKPAKKSLSDWVDALFTHRVLGLFVFALLMFLVFESIYTFASPAMDAIEATFTWLSNELGTVLEPMPILKSLVCDGIIAGVGGVMVFLPQIFLLFFFISLLEDTGYMARAAFMMDKLFSWCGLNGKSFVPLLSSYACAIPGLFATRTIEDPKARLVTILIAPLMSCSARLPVYLLMIGAFVQPAFGSTVAALTLFGFQVLGLVVALPIAWITNRWFLKIPAQPFVLEMPPYRLPVAKDVVWRMWMGGKEFIQRAGTIILVISIIVWALLYFPRTEGNEDDAVAQAAQVENSYLGQTGKFLQPIFEPAGFDWKITVGVLASFPAREVIVSTLGIIYRLGSDAEEHEDSLQEALRTDKWTSGPRTGQIVFTIPTALALMVFFAFCMQCASTLAVISREAGTRYAVITFVYMTALAWLGAVITYQIGSLFLP